MDYSKYNFPDSVLNLFGERSNEPDSWYDMALKKHFEAMTIKKDEFIKSKLIEKGFVHLIEGIEKRTFPKIAAIKQQGWTYIYADDDTEKGFFIVAIQDYDFSTDYSDKDFSTKMTCSLKWQDTSPLCVK